MSSIEGKRIRLLQKGVREELLCKECEGRFSAYENHARCVLYGGSEISVEELGKGIRVRGIDYRRFKLFLMSLLWRLSLTSLEYFRGVSLGERHQEKLRQMLVAETPGEPWEYGCTITGLLHEGKAFKDLISPPAWGKVEDHHFYTIAIGGFVFAFVVSSHRPDFIMQGFLHKNGELVVLRKEFTEIPFLMQIGSEVASATRGRRLPGTRA